MAQPVEIQRTKRITNVIDSYPMLSRDGTRLVFQSNRTGNWEIFTSDTSGNNLQQLTNNNIEDVTPCWSPDGKKIVFATGNDNTSEIWIMDADGTNPKKLTDVDGDDSHPHFSADGTKIIFNSARTTPDLKADWSKQWHEIFVMDADGQHPMQITSLKGVSTFPNFSPDGQKIVFRRVIDGFGQNWDLSEGKRNSEVFVMDLKTKELTNISNDPAFDGWPCWSPDGKNILFCSNRRGHPNVGYLYMYNLNDKRIRQISAGNFSYVQPSISADGKKIFAYEVYETPDYENGGIIMFELKD